MASYTKTYSGDLSSFIAGKLWDKVKEWDDNRIIDESDADPIVKEATKELKRKNDPNSIEVKDTSLREKVANIFGVGIDSKIVRTEDKVDKVAGRVSVVAGGIADTQKLIAVQNQLLEDKFDKILELYGVQNTLRKKEIEDAKAEQEELSLEENKQSSRGRQFARMMGLPTTFGTLLSQILWGATRKGLSKILRPLKRTLMRRIPFLRSAKLKKGVQALTKLSGGNVTKNLFNILRGTLFRKTAGKVFEILTKRFFASSFGRRQGLRGSFKVWLKTKLGFQNLKSKYYRRKLMAIERAKVSGKFPLDVPSDIIEQDPKWFGKNNASQSTLEGFLSPDSPLKNLDNLSTGDSLVKELTQEGVKQASKRTVKSKMAKKALGLGSRRLLAKGTLGKIPLVGALVGSAFAAERALKGDWFGSVAELASGFLSTIPGKGTAASYAIDAMLFARDLERAGIQNKAKQEAYNEFNQQLNQGANYDVGTKGAKSGNVHGTELIQKQSSAIATVVNPIYAATDLISGSLLGVANALGMKSDATSAIHDSGVDLSLIHISEPTRPY